MSAPKPKTNVVTLKEYNAARSFLSYLHADKSNTQLIFAVVAWMRAASGDAFHPSKSNNPFNIVTTKTTIHTRGRGIKYTTTTTTSNVYTSLDRGLHAAANALLKGTKADGFLLILHAFRTGSAQDVLAAIALSSWDAGQYAGPDGKGHTLPGQALINVFNSFTGMTLPPQAGKAPKIAPVKQPAIPPRHDLPVRREYLDPLAARGFYYARHDRLG